MKYTIVGLLTLVSISCADTSPLRAEREGVLQLLSGIEMSPVNFDMGAPGADEPLLSSVDGEFSRKALERNLEIILEHHSLRFEILGFTDSKECLDNECTILSDRRSKSVLAWFIANGAPPSSFIRSKGLGAEFPIDDNSTEEGRANNRRVEVNLIVY